MKDAYAALMIERSAAGKNDPATGELHPESSHAKLVGRKHGMFRLKPFGKSSSDNSLHSLAADCNIIAASFNAWFVVQLPAADYYRFPVPVRAGLGEGRPYP
ncbi:hypothetical protein [Burkholderia perseverans]|uniref:hypothetical protein n=1 Tax=Burkholderia perseverans TaxID=2615214 RepID=UPI001FEF3F5F|nr:hypothetical protein [Burkholderia perseverans]